MLVIPGIPGVGAHGVVFADGQHLDQAAGIRASGVGANLDVRLGAGSVVIPIVARASMAAVAAEVAVHVIAGVALSRTVAAATGVILGGRARQGGKTGL